jgi:hypothetical protein
MTMIEIAPALKGRDQEGNTAWMAQLNLGPLQFDTVLSRAYQIEEVQRALGAGGLKPVSTGQE